jgi:hypothetical protein
VRSVGNLLYALQRRPFIHAVLDGAAADLIWIGLGSAFGLNVWGDEIATLNGVEGCARPLTCSAWLSL